MYWGLRRSSSAAQEREIERGLLTHLRDLLLELGRGFSFVGSQVPLTVDRQTFYIDLLFYAGLRPAPAGAGQSGP
jgi:predicted nuclease of restriction endonuclease-like (RecB) superfamily